jgi:tRNA (guanine-N7-)-methyltransferase
MKSSSPSLQRLMKSRVCPLQVYDFVQARITAMRSENPPRGQNASVLRTNAMRYLPQFLQRGQLEKIFFCFPDPHFKAKNHRRRIISEVRFPSAHR